MTESTAPEKKSKGELEQLVKSNGGKFYQTHTAASDTICIADRSNSLLLDTMAWEKLIVHRDCEGGISAKRRPGKHHPSFMASRLRQTEHDRRRSF